MELCHLHPAFMFFFFFGNVRLKVIFKYGLYLYIAHNWDVGENRLKTFTLGNPETMPKLFTSSVYHFSTIPSHPRVHGGQIMEKGAKTEFTPVFRRRWHQTLPPPSSTGKLPPHCDLKGRCTFRHVTVFCWYLSPAARQGNIQKNPGISNLWLQSSKRRPIILGSNPAKTDQSTYYPWLYDSRFAGSKIFVAHFVSIAEPGSEPSGTFPQKTPKPLFFCGNSSWTLEPFPEPYPEQCKTWPPPETHCRVALSLDETPWV